MRKIENLQALARRAPPAWRSMKPYWILARDNFLRSAVLDSPDAVDTWIAAAEPGFTIALMQENAELATIANVQCSDVEELIETIINLTSPASDRRESFYTIYAHGGCDVFAVAQIGKASCRARVCQDVSISGVAGSVKKTKSYQYYI